MTDQHGIAADRPQAGDAPRPGGPLWRLADLAEALGLELQGDASVGVRSVASLEGAAAEQLAALYDARRAGDLAQCRASAVIATAAAAVDAPCPVLLSDNPGLAFARAAHLLHPERPGPSGVHATAVVDPTAELGDAVSIGPNAVVEAGARVEAGCRIDAFGWIGPGAWLGPECRIEAGARVGAGCRLGARCRVEMNAVLGADGFGFARDGSAWERIPQLGVVRLGDDVEVGAGAVIDRGSLTDTVLGDRVKLDNLVHVAHNCQIGEDTAIAAHVGIAGSTRIGARCTVGGMAGFADHIQVCDDAHFMGMAMVTSSIDQPGVYASGMPAVPAREWRRNAVQIARFAEWTRRLKAVEQQTARTPGSPAAPNSSSTEDSQ